MLNLTINSLLVKTKSHQKVGDLSSSSPNSQLKSNGTTLTSNGKPIQSILRRSETPPSTRSNNLRQTSIESNHSTREKSIEKLIKQTSSTSRPLMFNNKLFF